MDREMINTEVYEELGENWYEATDDPVALLRAESLLLGQWVCSRLSARSNVLDIGCGGGFLSNRLAQEGHTVTGIDLSADSLRVARNHDSTGQVRYARGDAYELPFEQQSFDAVCCMDFLEHVEDIGQVIHEASRVLRAGGLFFFHTFNRNPIAGLMVIKVVELLLPKTPKNLHLYRLVVRPSELRRYCGNYGLEVEELRGIRPVAESAAFLKSVVARKVHPDFRFTFTSSLLISYAGCARKSRLEFSQASSGVASCKYVPTN
jgi:2-polyprenyl-6-hydroxyphenyl methylase / 3-demethylubiquinone-9 3-methyltransferase